MALGAGAIALSSVSDKEHEHWQEAAHREGRRYSVSKEYVQAGLAGEAKSGEAGDAKPRSMLDWLIVAVTSVVFVWMAGISRVPDVAVNWSAALLLSALLLVFLLACGTALWKSTRFS